MLGSFKGDKEIKQMEDEREGGREKKREGERGIGEREREKIPTVAYFPSLFYFLFPLPNSALATTLNSFSFASFS